MNKIIKQGFENKVLTPALLKSNFNTIRERVKIYITRKFHYTNNGNRLTSYNVDDYLQSGIEKLLTSFDFETCLFQGNEIKVIDLQRLWFRSTLQVIYGDNVRSKITKKGIETKIVIGNIVADMDGKQVVSDKVENKLIQLDSTNTKIQPKMNVRSLIRKAIEMSETNSDRKFYERVLAHLLIENSIRKANKVSKAIPLTEIIDCFENQFQNIDVYTMFKKRMITDVRLKKLKMVA
jgi:hypothetical protein